MIRFFMLTTLLLLSSNAFVLAQPVYLDLTSFLDIDAILEPGGTGLGEPLHEDVQWIDANSLPAGYQDNTVYETPDGRTTFQFEPFFQESYDSFLLDGQLIDVPDGQYDSLDLALLSEPDSFINPFDTIEFRYSDGSSGFARLGPISGVLSPPAAFDNTFFRYTDDSGVNTIFSIDTDFGEDDTYYLLQEQGNGNAGGNRFIDGTGYALYLFDELQGVEEGTLGVTVGNNFVISIATEYWDPNASTTEGYTVLANSMELYDGFEHRSLGNLKQYTFDVTPYLQENTGELWVLFTDATPSNGWGPYLQNITLFTGETRVFEKTLDVSVDSSNADVYAMFQTDGNEEEANYLYDNSASGPSNRGHRFADGNGSLTYQFDLPDDVQEAKLTVDMANNFVVSLSGPSDVIRYDSMTVGTADENDYLIDEGGSIPGSDFRFADGNNYMVYQFDLPNDISTALANIHVGNQFVIEVASGENGEFQVKKDWVAESGEETTDNSNLDFYLINISSYLSNNPENIVRIRLSDGIPTNGWGPYLKSIVIVNKEESGENTFEEVLNSMDMFGEDIHNESNKDYYTIDLSSQLENNPGNEVFVQFTDASTGDGWGPGVFWMAVYSGELEILTDRNVFENLKTVEGLPENGGLTLLNRRYALDTEKTLSEIALPSPESDNNVIIFAATLNSAETSVPNWMIYE